MTKNKFALIDDVIELTFAIKIKQYATGICFDKVEHKSLLKATCERSAPFLAR